MLPTTSTNSFIYEASDDTITNAPWSIENYAEGLMDELFMDIDAILDGRNKRHYNKSRYSGSQPSEYVSRPTVRLKMSDILPSTVKLPQESVTPISNKQSSTLVVTSRPITVMTNKQHSNHLAKVNQLIFVSASLTITFFGFIFLKENGFLNSLINSEYAKTATIETLEDPLLNLVIYMQEALTVIERKEEINGSIGVKSELYSTSINQPTTLGLPNRLPSNTLPISVTANTQTTPSNRNTTQNVIERIYIPMSQPSPNYQTSVVPNVTSLPTLTPLPPVSSVPTTVAPTTKISQTTPVEVWKEPIKNFKNNTKVYTKPTEITTIGTTAKIPALKSQPLPVNSQPVTIAPPKLLTPNLSNTVPLLPTNIPAEEPAKVNEKVYLSTYTAQLDGLLELSNKSVALFKIDGISRRISIGESIGATGWTLVEVSNGKAVVYRNGELRSIYTGQKL
ncbi:hypothetical protein H6F32_01590 [Anabaena sp. FACHB-1237]|uniref:hypothetical protein n=1 Tax=Anabaena sp. FACHB-1237 TaxID=2692769 RepID=UPI0016801122|nr:hypothetical protein [Anabaena sp. FACHB-1237]MBD2136303.1 hypothetical protein [Anabaena sp. FACHB-1237]